MLILNAAYEPVCRLAPVLLARRERVRTTTIVRLLGRLVAYLPEHERAYYAWLLTLTYQPAQYLSVHQFCPPHLRVRLGGRLEIGLVLKHWLLGLRLGQPLVWVRRTAEATVRVRP